MSANTKQRGNESAAHTKCAPRASNKEDSDVPLPISDRADKLNKAKEVREKCFEECRLKGCYFESNRKVLHKALGEINYKKFAAGPVTDACVSLRQLNIREDHPAFFKVLGRKVVCLYLTVAARAVWRFVLAIPFVCRKVVMDDLSEDD